MKGLAILLLFCIYSFAQEQTLPIVETCFISDKKEEGKCILFDDKKDSIWRLIPYKENYPFIVSVESRCKKCIFHESVSLTLDAKFSSLCYYANASVSLGNGKVYSKNFDKNVNLTEHTSLEFSKINLDGENFSPQSFFEKDYSIEWTYSFFTGTQKQEFKSKIPIYISGFCTEEQLKQAANLKEEHAQERKIRERIEKQIRKEMTAEDK